MSELNIEPTRSIGNSQNQEFNNLPRFLFITANNDDYDAIDRELISKANKWSIPIPYYKKAIDFSALENEVCEYESLVIRAQELGMRWDMSNYCPVALSCAIEEEELASISINRDSYRSYY